MKSNYKKLGQFIKQVDIRNKEDKQDNLLGVSTQKIFIPSVANTIGTDFKKYKIVKKFQFTYVPDTSRRGDKIGIAMLEDRDEALVSQAYTVFEVIDENKLLPQFLMMWFRREEFDRYARYKSHGSVREIFDWEEMCDVELPVPSIDKQKEIVKEYHTIVDRIELNEELNQKLEDTAQSIYKEWFVNFEFPDVNGKPYKSNGGEMEYCNELDVEIPINWSFKKLNDLISFSNGYAFKSDELLDFTTENCFDVFKMGNIKKGGGLNYKGTKNWYPKNKIKGLESFVIKQNDVLMCMTDMKESLGLLGNTALINHSDNYILNQRVGLLRVNNSFNIGSYTIYTITNSENFLKDLRSRANLGVQVNLTKDAIISTNILIADNKINQILEETLEKVIRRILQNYDFNKLLDKLKKVLLSKMATIEG